MADDLSVLSVAKLIRAYRDRTLSPVDVAEALFERIARYDGALHSYVELTRDLALAQAREAERAYAAGEAQASRTCWRCVASGMTRHHQLSTSGASCAP